MARECPATKVEIERPNAFDGQALVRGDAAMNFAPWATLAAAALGLSAFAGDSRAEPVNLARMTLGYSYYNRPGADLATHNNELADCLAEATKVRSLDEQLHNGQGMGLVGALVGDALSSAAHRGVVAASLEN